MDEGAHVALWFLWMFGAPEAVTGFLTPSLLEPQSGVEDSGVLLYRYASGMIGIHQSSWTELASTSTVEISGDRGVIVATGTDITAERSMASDEPPLRIWRHDPDGPAASSGPVPPEQPNPAGHWDYPAVTLPRSRLQGTAQAFAQMLVEGTPSPADAHTARSAVEMVLAGYRSSREGRTVTLPLPRESAEATSR